jgi:hypothetical protein
VGRSKSTATIVNTGKKPTDGKCSADFVAFHGNQVPRPVLSLPATPMAGYTGRGGQEGGRYCVPLYLPTARHAPVTLVGTLEALPRKPPLLWQGFFLRIDRTIQEHYCGCQVGQIQHIARTTRGRGMGLSGAIASLPHTYLFV